MDSRTASLEIRVTFIKSDVLSIFGIFGLIPTAKAWYFFVSGRPRKSASCNLILAESVSSTNVFLYCFEMYSSIVVAAAAGMYFSIVSGHQ